jgi:transcriptional regulator with XRE-family HTH domain
MVNIKKYAGKQFRELRNLRGLTQVELARWVGVGPASISTYECGKSMPRPEIFYRLCSILKAQPSDIFPTIKNVRPIAKVIMITKSKNNGKITKSRREQGKRPRKKTL